MWSFNQALQPVTGRIVVITGLIVVFGSLSGCGFHPMYGAAGVGNLISEELGQVDIAIIADRSGQILRNCLIHDMNPSGIFTNLTYRLNIRLKEVRTALGIRSDTACTRYFLKEIASYTLVRLSDNTPVFRGESYAVAHHNYLKDLYETYNTENATRERILRQISDDIRTQIALFLRR
jgi:LPS-assembly lipoprotein